MLCGFRHALISVRRSDMLEVVATGGEGVGEMLGSALPVKVLEREMDGADRWGTLLRFVPHERADAEALTYSYIPDLERVDHEDSWHPLDLLAAPLYDDDGILRGLLSVDVPVDGLRPGQVQREVLQQYAGVARSSVLAALEREELGERVRLVTEVRELVRRAVGETSLESVLEACRSAVVKAFHASGMWLSAFDSDGGTSTTWYSEGAHDRPRLEELGALPSDLARHYWEDQYVAHFSRTHRSHPILSDDHASILLDFMERIDISSVLFVPIGAGAECLGFLVLARESEEPAWTEVEHDAALEIGRDLGRAVANARQLDGERALVNRLRELDGYRTKMMNTVAHEVRSPLTSVVANLELVAEEKLSAQGRRSVEAAIRGAVRIEGILSDLLTVAKVSDSGAAFDPVEVDFLRVCRDAVDEASSVAAARSITISPELPEESVHVDGYLDELHRVVANLLSNAIKFSDEGSSVVITLAVCGDDVTLTVVDHGLGISSEDEPHLFREFHRSTNPEALRRPGTGLGLVIVERIVRRHGGTIDVRSELGQGTKVIVSLPTAARASRRGGS